MTFEYFVEAEVLSVECSECCEMSTVGTVSTESTAQEMRLEVP